MGNVEDVGTYMRKTLRGRSIEVLCNGIERRNLTVDTFQRSRELMEEDVSGQKNSYHTKVVASAQSRKSGFMFAYLCMRPCVVEDKEGGKILKHKGIAFGYLNLGLYVMRAFDTHFINC